MRRLESGGLIAEALGFCVRGFAVQNGNAAAPASCVFSSLCSSARCFHLLRCGCANYRKIGCEIAPFQRVPQASDRAIERSILSSMLADLALRDPPQTSAFVSAALLRGHVMGEGRYALGSVNDCGADDQRGVRRCIAAILSASVIQRSDHGA